MATSKLKPAAHNSRADSSEAVDTYMAQLQHPCKAEVQALRRVIVSVDPSIAEGVKWNAPSFRTTEYFATTNLRAKAGVGLILHLGAKARDLPVGGVAIQDPIKMLKWLGKDRAMVEFGSMSEIEASKEALQAILRQWVRYV
jgi:hypothetical protein